MAKKLNLKPLRDTLIVEPQEHTGKIAGGMLLTMNSREKRQRGTVLAAGPGRLHAGKRIEMTVKTGDVVLFAGSNGSEIKIDHRKLLILKESDILAIITL